MAVFAAKKNRLSCMPEERFLQQPVGRRLLLHKKPVSYIMDWKFAGAVLSGAWFTMGISPARFQTLWQLYIRPGIPDGVSYAFL